MTRFIALPDGRDLAYEDYGDPLGSPILSFHGGLSSRLDAAPADAAARELGIRLISPDRPGMGRSTRRPGRTLLDWVGDVTVLCDTLGLERFATMGWSCGGPYAAVCAAKMPDRVTGVALLASAIPLDIYGTTKGLTTDDRILLFLVRRAPFIASGLMRFTIANASEQRIYEVIRHSFPAPDRASLEERGSAIEAVAFIKESMRYGTGGCVDDYRIFGDPWGFALEEIIAPVHIWEGTEDHTGPSDYRTFLAAHLPSAHVHLVPGEGHLSLLPHHAGDILKHLLG
jgi:pimeloyl-ACP methyl ester carboxylesterase